MALWLRAPAKVNLELRVLGRREDGYFELWTVLHALALEDRLWAERSQAGTGIQLEVQLPEQLDQRLANSSGLAVAEGEDNLVYRAARCFLEAVGVGGGFRFLLQKRIPAGVGLGGGSSDAAAALRLMNHLCQHPLDAQALHELASSLGADVPFFLEAGTQLGLGRGDQLHRVARPPRLHFLLILPSTGTSTATVYENLPPHLTEPATKARIRTGQVPDYEELALATGFRNDLEVAALGLHPELGDLRRRIAGLGYPEVRMSGSGSTFFLAFGREDACARARGDLLLLQEQGVCLLKTASRASQPEGIPEGVPEGIKADRFPGD